MKHEAINFKNLLAFFLAFSVCVISQTKLSAQQNPDTDLYLQSSEVANVLVQYEADKGSLLRFYFIDSSPERRIRFKQFYNDYLKRLNAIDFNSISQQGKIDYILFDRKLKNEIAKLDLEEKEYNQIASYIPFSTGIYSLEKARRRGPVLRADSIAAEMNTWNKQLTQQIKKFEKGDSLERNLSTRCQMALGGLVEAMTSVTEFYDGYDPSFTWWTERPAKVTDSLLRAYKALVKNKTKITTSQKADSSGIVGKPIGREELIRQLEYEMIPYTPEEIIDIANKEFAWCDNELMKATKEMGFGTDWRKAQEKVKNSYVPEGRQPELILRLYNESVDFLKKHDLVTVPPIAEETWRMNMMSPERQLINPFFLGGEEIIISYPTNTMDHDDKMMSMRGNNPHFSRSTVHHELIAGHRLQLFMSDRYRPYRKFQTPFFVEGWALYWEFLLWDMGFPQTPEDKIGMLFWRMHRCARIIFSMNYHLNKWTPQQCINFLVDRVGHERANAEGEVRRSFTGNYEPLYQIAYMLGGLQFYALKKEVVDSGKMTYKQYHDAILQNNMMPVEMVRAGLLNIPLQKDFKTNWRFYGK